MLEWFYKKIAAHVKVPPTPTAQEIAAELQKIDLQDHILKAVTEKVSYECYFSNPRAFEDRLVYELTDAIIIEVTASVVNRILQNPSLSSELSAQLMQRIVDKLSS